MKLGGVLWGFRETPPRPPKAMPAEALGCCEGHTFEDTRYHKTHRAVKQSRPKRPREAGRGPRASEPLLCCRVPGAKAGTREGAEAANPIWTGCSLACVQLLVKPAGRLPPAPGGCELGGGQGQVCAPPRDLLGHPEPAPQRVAPLSKAKGHHGEGQATS